MAEAGYMSMHLTPRLADKARAYAAKLGHADLGEGLRPVGTSS
ncbi:MAG TPA: hypothetical protein VN805_09720 [Caulobacteraceae bacterium]|nr:hypothetical protein [Caulobacteraceae bacterium]